MESSNLKRTIIGAIFVIIGSIFLLENLGIAIKLPWYLFKWPIILVILGLVNLLIKNIRSAFILLGLGTLFYLDIFDVFDLMDAWPIILIIIGISFIFKKSSPEDSAEEKNNFDEISILSSIDKKFNSQQLLGGKITSVLGGSKIDLREAKLKENNATIELFCLFGGTEIFIPENWEVSMNTTTILGGFDDDRKSYGDEKVGTLHIKGFVMFGGGDIKN